ncbi:MAG TPA: hypothetical protein VMT62_07925 [Syntrophorhabdaceae bacterium]|nr:hypothetical protein [Syntrophorhabdaceae bacterium]
MKTITIIGICFLILVSVKGFATGEELQGQIVASLEGKVKMLLGDKALVNLGQRDGIIKGDIFTIYGKADVQHMDAVGKCAVIKTYETADICEIIKMRNEIGSDMVTIPWLRYTDANLFPAVFGLMTKTVDPYEPEKEIKVYVHSIYDEHNNITEFSERVQREIRSMFSQKKRIKIVTRGEISPAFFAYLPNEYAKSKDVIEEYMKKDDVDVVVTGTYRTAGDKIELSLYKIDRKYEDIVLDASLIAAPYAELAAKVTAPYVEKRKEQNITCTVHYEPVYYKATARDERNDIIEQETRNNPFLEYSMKRIDFNIVSPVDFKLKIDNDANEIKFDKGKSYKLLLTTGDHEITASFKKGYFFNESLLLAVDNEVKKHVKLSLDKTDDIVIEIEANPVPGRENIDFKVYKKAVQNKPVIKPVLQKNLVDQTETFKE